jgi:predicted Rossmann fold flavoprotein
MIFDVIVIGGGPAGFFAAIHCAETALALTGSRPRIRLVEASQQVLGKVRISGGGRCNVTHAEFDPRIFASRYPRGGRELLGPLTQFGALETLQWFEKRGVGLKTEQDGRIFPISNRSETIVKTLVDEADRVGVSVSVRSKVVDLTHVDTDETHPFKVQLAQDKLLSTRQVLVSTGASQTALRWARTVGGHRVTPLVPSLFSFVLCTQRHPWVSSLAGISVPEVDITFVAEGETASAVHGRRRCTLKESGPLLFTHLGISGPSVLALSAFGARIFHECDYNFMIQLNFLPKYRQCADALERFRTGSDRRLSVVSKNPFGLPRRLWSSLIIQEAGIDGSKQYANLNAAEIKQIELALTKCHLQVIGRSPFKDEFVTAGGVDLRDIHMATCESKLIRGLYFAGEVLDVDAVTGGFNLQNAWTTGYCAGVAMAVALAHPNEASLGKQ